MIAAPQTAFIVPDLLAPGLKLVFCGSALGFESARQKAYYAKPGNKFWPTLHEIGLTPRRFAPHDYPKLLELGIGLTDINKVQFGNDTDLSPEHDDAAGLAAKIRQFKPAILAFTAKRPAQVFLRAQFGIRTPPPYGLLDRRFHETRLFVLPSPSGRAGSFWTIEPWRKLKALYDVLP
ncbi:mismatch-specific DNA-glycosylase [uncultured Ferrovibrio sp.]|uniref:mismatch-specific DNA-glycosylase n=1 Tax=uncultured Ferrovibrio sp. TaxID=1576913 RepID=UPI002619DF12|nr:mismatch-specific DNA-glycosylase [uncultured Ferrovibrio sp.]